MSDSNTNGGNANLDIAPEARTRDPRNNHAVALSHRITDDASAQSFADAAREATRNDKTSTMYNSSGFITPATLDRQDAENRERLGVSIIDSLSASVEVDGEDGQRARQSLILLASYAASAGESRESARNARILLQADQIRAKHGKKAPSRS